MHTVRETDTRAQQVEPAEAVERALSEEDQHTLPCGCYGRGIYAGHSTFGRDFCTPGSYGRGISAGHRTFDRDYDIPGSYGRGIYAGHNTYDLDFRRKDSYARGMEQPPAHVVGQHTSAAVQRTQH